MALAAQLIEEFKDLPDAQQRAFALAINISPPEDRRSPEFEEFLKGIGRSSSIRVRAAEAQVRRELAYHEAERLKREMANKQADREVAKEIAFAPVPLEAAGEKEAARCFACIPAGDGCDVFCASRTLFLMRKRGKLEALWTTTQDRSGIGPVVFDGRYVWGVFNRFRRSPSLVVIDLETKEASYFSATDGLPGDDAEHEITVVPDSMILAPIEPGRVLAAGLFGRTWLGVASFDGVKKAVRVIHEARDVADPADLKQGLSTTVSFQPLSVHVAQHKAIVSRGSQNQEVLNTPLIVDIRQKAVAPADVRFAGRPAVVDDRLFYIRQFKRTELAELVSLPFPALKESQAMLDPPDGLLIGEGTDLHIIGNKWWIYDTAKNSLRTAASPVPWYYIENRSYQGRPPKAPPSGDDHFRLVHVYRSNHYGILAFVGKLGQEQFVQGLRAKSE
jgi:hypothetical protein